MSACLRLKLGQYTNPNRRCGLYNMDNINLRLVDGVAVYVCVVCMTTWTIQEQVQGHANFGHENICIWYTSIQGHASFRATGAASAAPPAAPAALPPTVPPISKMPPPPANSTVLPGGHDDATATASVTTPGAAGADADADADGTAAALTPGTPATPAPPRSSGLNYPSPHDTSATASLAAESIISGALTPTTPKTRTSVPEVTYGGVGSEGSNAPGRTTVTASSTTKNIISGALTGVTPKTRTSVPETPETSVPDDVGTSAPNTSKVHVRDLVRNLEKTETKAHGRDLVGQVRSY